MEDEDLIVWQDVLDEIAAGRGSDLSCPFCRTGKLEVATEVVGGPTRISCPRCKKFIEGHFSE